MEDLQRVIASETRKDRRYSYIYLVNMLIPIGFLALFPLPRAMVGALMIGLFTVVYLFTYRLVNWRPVLVSGQIAIMMTMMAYLSADYIWMIFYPATSIALCFKSRRVPALLLIMVALLVSETYIVSRFQALVLGDWLMILAAVIAGVASCYGTIWQSRTMKSREQLRKANLEIERLTKVAERDRISQDLHDVMGHELSIITLKSQLAVKLMDKDVRRAKEEVRDIEHAARQALTRVREYVAGIRQPNLHEEWRDAIKLLQAAGIQCDAEGLSTVTELNNSVHVLAMCLREATTNLVRHSHATACQLRFCGVDDIWMLTISDNGLGLHAAPPHGVSQGGNGLNGIRARTALVDGTVRLWSNGVLLDSAGETSPSPSPWTSGVCLQIVVPAHASADVDIEEADA